MNYIPPINFGCVEDDLYRSGAPNELNFPFLEKLHLKKIIYLAPEEPSEQL
jgi:tyrosine-protein phosphatase OCA1